MWTCHGRREATARYDQGCVPAPHPEPCVVRRLAEATDVSNPVPIDRLMRAGRQRGWIFAAVALWCAFLAWAMSQGIALRGWSLLRLPVIIFFAVMGVLLAVAAWRGHRSRRSLVRALRAGRVAKVQVTLSRNAEVADDPDTYAMVVGAGMPASPPIMVTVNWAGPHVWDEPLPGDAYIDIPTGDWRVIVVPSGVVYR